ncbi:MAG: twin-arginine translocase TatA/TatE family subunit [Phycisphaeraceae bacterium]
MLTQMEHAVLAFWTPGPWELAVLAVVGVLIFGKRLPEVGRSIGQGIVEFKRGLSSAGSEPSESRTERPQIESKPEGAQMSDESAEKAADPYKNASESA